MQNSTTKASHMATAHEAGELVKLPPRCASWSSFRRTEPTWTSLYALLGVTKGPTYQTKAKKDSESGASCDGTTEIVRSLLTE